MAEENPHIEIKKFSQPINNSRQQYLFENENLILGRHGFIFSGLPTIKQRFKEKLKDKKYMDNNSNLNNNKLHKTNSLGRLDINGILEKKDKKSRNNNISQILSTNSSKMQNISQPILRFKNRTDLERICDTIQPYVPPNEQEALKEIRARHVHSIDFPNGILYRGSLKNIKTFKKNLNTSTINARNSKNFEIDINKEYENAKNKPKIFFTRLQRLNVEAKKIRSNLHYKTHFKGVESILINPKQIYGIIKKDEGLNSKGIGFYAYNDKYEKDKIEKRNEYKKDINDLLLEEKEKQKIINTKEFSNYLNNKEYYNDRVINNSFINEENEEEKIKKINDMNYLKNLAFNDRRKSEKNSSNNESGNDNTDASVDGQKKKKLNFENENQLRIKGKLFHMQNQMDQIAREILNKCNFYSIKK